MRKNVLVSGVLLLSIVGCGREVPKRHLTQMEIQSLFTHKNLGLAFLEEEQAQNSIEAFQIVVELAPEDPLGYANQALAYLRLRKKEETLQWIQKALQIAPNDPEVHLIMAEIYEWGKEERKVLKELEKVIQLDPDNLIARYKRVRYYSGRRGEPEASQVIEKELLAIAERTPENIAVLMDLGQAHLTNNKPEEAREVYQKLHTLSQDLNPETLQYLRKGFDLLEAGQIQEAKSQMMIFENVQRNTPRYQKGRKEIVGHLLGSPIASFSPALMDRVGQILLSVLPEPVPVIFTEITEKVGLKDFGGEGMAIGDIDGDGDPDLYLAPHLFRNDGGTFVKMGRFGDERGGVFADFDNDGDPDLFNMNKGPNHLYKNDGKGVFQKLKETFGENGSSALFFDFDHDGDLDLFVTQEDGENLLFENNIDAPFTEIAGKVGITGERGRDCAYGDFDDDGDLDLIVLYEDRLILYSNLRQGRFRAIPVVEREGLSACEVGDINNDGSLDIVVTGWEIHINHIYINQGDGSFQERGFPIGKTASAALEISDVLLFDFDNDGYLDILLVGENGIALQRNDGRGGFIDISLMLPEDVRVEAGRAFPLQRGFAANDFDSDGDLDLFLLGEEIHLLRNDGGNQNHWLDVKLVGLGVGAGKNNVQGLGARLEVKAGDLYQLKVVTDPVTHFGLGQREEADVIRVVWTNGVSQNRVKPGIDLVFTEEQILKGSCPFLYTWNGEKFQFVTDLLWRSMLGMITGNQTAGFHEAAEEYIKIPGSSLVSCRGGPECQPSGEYHLRITQELWEIPYIDEMKLMVVDSPPEVLEVHVDERFLPPPFPPFEIYSVKEKIYPRKAFDEKGRDLLPLLLARDGKEVSEFERSRYQGITNLHDLILDFNPAPGRGRVNSSSSIQYPASSSIFLFLYGWLIPTDTSINIAIGKTRSYKPILPYLQVPNAKGEWVTVLNPIWFPAGRNKMMVVDLTDKFLCDDYRVKITTTMEIHWDEAFITLNESSIQPAILPTGQAGSEVEWHPASSIKLTTLSPSRADLRYHGFSKVVQSDGISYSASSIQQPEKWPFGFPRYDEVTNLPLWRDAEGYYTRYGNVTPLLQKSDNQYVIMKTGDELALSFSADEVPKLPDDWHRDFILFTNGWLKDTEINAVAGETVEPLPFHGMSKYPYAPPEAYPGDAAHAKYLREYNTRLVTQDPFKDFVKTYPRRSPGMQ